MLITAAHAKVNLCLAVRGRRPDRFHDIDSVVVTIDWHDLLGIRLHPAEVTTVRLTVVGDTGDLPSVDANLAALAGRAFASAAGPLDMELWLDKRLPGAAGLGGGSADAAAVLRGCSSLLATHGINESELGALAASLGSDVPVLMQRGTQRVRGRGEDVTRVSAPKLHLAVAVVGASSTAATYAGLMSADFEDAARSDAVAAALELGRRPDDELLGSGLEPAACRVNPQLGERLLALRTDVSAARWHLTGSGGAAFALAGSAGHAKALVDAAVAAGFPARACHSLSG
jgi:4-diphosphocytidyl-2-C-methyl-D-erythritol kinase